MKLLAALALVLLPGAATAAGPAWTLAEAKRALLARPKLVIVDRTQPDRPSFTLRIERIAPGELQPLGRRFVFAGKAHELRTDATVRVRFIITPLARGRFAVSGFRGPRANTSQPRFPLRAAFYYPWFPRNWTQQGVYPFSSFRPSLGYYDSTSPRVVRTHLEAMRYGNIDVGVYSWWGRGSEEDRRFSLFLAAARSTPFRWSVYYEPEGYGNPSVEELRADLVYIRDRYGSSPAFLRVGGRLVIFVYGDGLDGCETPVRWHEANAIGAYLVLKVFPGFETCPVQPDGWHQYEPARAEFSFPPWSFTISPGFSSASVPAPRLERDLFRWRLSLGNMIVSRARFQLITSFNEWGDGTAIESADEWATPSGYGAYLDVLHENP